MLSVRPPFRRSRVSRGQPATGQRDCLPEKEGAAHSVPAQSSHLRAQKSRNPKTPKNRLYHW